MNIALTKHKYCKTNQLRLLLLQDLNKKRGIKTNLPQTISLKVLLTNDKCGGLLGLRGENKREIEKNTGVSLVISKFYEEQYRTAIVSVKRKSISLFVQRVVELQVFINFYNI